MPSTRKPVHDVRPDITQKKERQARTAASSVKTKREEKFRHAKRLLNDRRLPGALYDKEEDLEQPSQGGTLPPDSTIDGNTTATFPSPPKESVEKISASKLSVTLLETHLRIKPITIEVLHNQYPSELWTNPYQKKDYTCSAVSQMEEPTCKPEHSVECSLSWLEERFTEAVLLLPEHWKTIPPKEMCNVYHLPDEWQAFLRTPNEGPFPESPDICELPAASSDEHLSASQKEQMNRMRMRYALGEHRARNHLLARLFEGEISALNELPVRAKAHRTIMKELTMPGMDGKPEPVPGVLFLPREQILARNISGCEGNIMYNEDKFDRQRTPQEFIRKWLSHCGDGVFKAQADYPESEMVAEREAGHLLHGLHPKTGVFTTLNDQKCTFTPLLTYFGCAAKPDSARRPTSAMLPSWDSKLLPALWVTEAKANSTTPTSLLGAPQVAPVVMPAIVMFILFYLDTRRSLNEPLPSWAFIFSLLYNKDGYDIYVHYPRYDETQKGWGAYFLLYSAHKTIFTDQSDRRKRIRALAIMQRMQSHELFVLERFKEWTDRGGYDRCIKFLEFALPA